MQIRVFSQEPFAYTLNDENGLPSNEVYRVTQDNEGYIWIGCDAGLFRYDGLNFIPFSNPKQNSRGISGLVFDHENRLWCHNFSGQLFRVEKNKLELICDFSNEANKYQITHGDKRGFWKISSSAITLYDFNGKLISSYAQPLLNDAFSYGLAVKYFNDKLWLDLPNRGLHFFRESTGELISVAEPFVINQDCQARDFFVKDSMLYLLRSETYPSTWMHLYEIDAKKINMRRIIDLHNLVQIRNYFFYEDRLHQLWIGSSFGAICYPDVRAFTSPRMVIYTNSRVSSVLHDKEGNYWFSTLQRGILMAPDLDVIYMDTLNSPLKNNAICHLKMLSNDLLAIGNFNGQFQLYYEDWFLPKVILPESVNAFIGITVKDIEEYGENILISRGRLFIYNKINGKAFYDKDFSNIRDMCIWQDTLYIITPISVNKASLNELEEKKGLDFITIKNSGGWKVEVDRSSGDVYYAMNDGLFVYSQGKLTKILNENESINVSCIAERKGSIWVGTQSMGLLEIKNKKIVRSRLKPESSVDYNSIKLVYADSIDVWIITDQKIYRLDPEKDHLEIVSKNIGISSKEITSVTGNKSYLYLGTAKYMQRISRKISAVNSTPPDVKLTLITCENDTIKSQKNGIRLNYDFTNLQFHFIALSYGSWNKLRYEYRMQGLDTSWNTNLFNNTTAIYSSLPPGEYTFQVRALNESGISGNYIEVPIVVSPPLWQKGWFYLIVSIVAIVLVVFFFQYRIRLIRKRNTLEKKVIASQLTALKAQMNPHFMYNALNSIQDLMLSQDLQNSNRYLGRFSSLMRKVLDASGKESITLEEECAMLELYLDLEKLRFGDGFSFSINVDSGINQREVFIPPMVLQPYVENAMKHGLLHKKGTKTLSIQFSLSNQLECTIIDNGVGRKRSAEIKTRKHQSFASDAVEKRLELLKEYTRLNYSVAIEDLEVNGESTGTKVKIRFPITDDL
ncbi:MAG TPA: histidine kinase [Flavobacteriales bacterium]|nr:histidine kinase [Flavobacteriales bacterium]HRJ37154.1 histidine kinase [Flavobacteriales bacterium]